MADIYGANLYNRYLQTAQRAKTHMQAKGVAHASEPLADSVDGVHPMTSTELGGGSNVYETSEEPPEGCCSILVCTGVYSRDQQELPSDPNQTVTEQRIFHGHRDFRFDPSLTQPSFVVEDVKEAVELVFQQEGWPLQ